MMEPSRANFCHPYEPYDIQMEFMKNLYQSIEEGKVAVFESPTGTGKSLSLICSALTWLRDDARRQIEGSYDIRDGDECEDWLVTAEKAVRRRDFLHELIETEEKLIAVHKRETARQEASDRARASKRARFELNSDKLEQADDSEYLLDDYASGDEDTNGVKQSNSLSSSTLALLEKLKPVVQEETEADDGRTKVMFCSRTHSQLTQFINELRRVTPPSGLPQDAPFAGRVRDEIVRHIALGSRKNLCINEKVSRLSSTLAINERCLELQKPGTAKDKKCKYLPGRDDKAKVEAFRDRAIATIRDIEDLGELGRKMDICPYYASRSAISSSEILTLPYPLLLQKSAREALGVVVRDNIVVIDEAHNLMDAIADTLSMSLSLEQLEIATKQVICYVQRFKHKLKGLNRMYVTQLIRLLNSFTDCLQSAIPVGRQDERVVNAADLLAGKGVDQVKPHKLLQYLIKSKLGHKVESYIETHEDTTVFRQQKGVLMHFQSFLAVLMNPDSEGRFFVSRQENGITVRYTLLDPQEHFRSIVEQARAVILAGGTMSPMSDYKEYLFPYLDQSRFVTFSFGHVIPKENMLVSVIAKGPTGIDFDFTFEKRNSENIIVDLGNTLIQLCKTVPDGVVVFFPSYDYLTRVTDVWKRMPEDRPILSSLLIIKKVFEEVRGVSSDSLLGEYSQAIYEDQGAIMLSVVGGKLSEGINFSDKLGRAVVAVGLPFPNIHSAEWKAKIEHVEQIRYKRCRGTERLSEDVSKKHAKAAGQDYYENACMRAINQSIGRAIRHKNDYAAIVLIDRRFAAARIQQKLPRWIQGSMDNSKSNYSWTLAQNNLGQFFKNKRSDKPDQ